MEEGQDAAPFEAHQMMLDGDLLLALTSGDMVRLQEILSGVCNGHWQKDHVVSISAHGAAPAAGAAVHSGTSCLFGVTNNGNTALHLAASRGHIELVRLICERAPSLAATRNKCLDTPLHCAAKAGHGEVASCLLPVMEKAVLLARNRLGATALYEAVRNGRADVVDLLMREAPELASLTSGDGVSPLYVAAATGSVDMVQALLRPSPDDAPSSVSYAGPEGRTALHVAATRSKDIAQEILDWMPEGPTLQTNVDSSGRTPLHFAVSHGNLDAVQLLLQGESETAIAHISDADGLFPLHLAAMWGGCGGGACVDGLLCIIDELTKKCPDYYELVDDQGRNFLHCAVEHNREIIVRYICQNERFAMLLNATDYEGNTALHLAVRCGHTQIVILLLQTMSVEIGITNNDGLTARDLAYKKLELVIYRYFLNPRFLIMRCLWWVGAPGNPDAYPFRPRDGNISAVGEETKEHGNLTATKTMASVLIATVTFAAASAVPGGYVADDHPHAGAATMARRFAFRAFAVSDAMAFLCSIVATCFLIYAGTTSVPLEHRRWYHFIAARILPAAAQFMIAAFAFGIHVVLGALNRWFINFVYMISLVSVLFCIPGIWEPLHLGIGKAIWRRAGWRGLVNISRRPSSLRTLFYHFNRSFLFEYLLTMTLLPLFISATFVVSFTLNIALPNF